MKSIKKLTCLILVLMICLQMVVLQTGCSNSTSYRDNNKDNEIIINSSQAAFDNYTNEVFTSMVTSSTLALHSSLKNPADYGIDSYTVTLGSYNPDCLDDTSMLIDYLNRLKEFDYNNLSASQQLTYNELLMYLENELEYSDLYMFWSPLSPTTGLQVSLPIIYAEYSFNCTRDIEDYLELISQTDRYFGEILEFETLRSSKGMFMENSVADSVIAQCQTFVDNSDNGYLITTFNDRINEFSQNNALTPTQIEVYKTSNLNAVNNHVIPAYNLLIDGLASLKNTNRYSGGLCNYPNGDKYYEYLLKSELGWSKSVKELDALLDTYINIAFAKISTILKNDYHAIDRMSSFSFRITDPDKILTDLKQRINKDFPTPPDVDYDIKYINDALKDYASPAMYFLPQIDNITENVIYINPGSSDTSSLYATLAHEGYPGHMYQSTYFASTNPNPIRTIISPSGYIEGWASYCELYSYTLEDSSDINLSQLMQANYLAILCIYSKVDIGINYYGWNCEDTTAFLAEYGFTDTSVANEIYYAMVSEPANYPKYSLGCIAFLELKNTAQTALGERFIAKDFHKFLMELGPIQFDIVEQELNKWIAEYN